MRSKQNC